MKKSRKNTAAGTANPYKSARLHAAGTDESLSTAENAAAKLLIRREKYLQIEQDVPGRKTAEPTADEVMRMIRLYRAPELRSLYCAEYCPLGYGEEPAPAADSLDRIAVRLLVALRRMEQARDELDNILIDGLVEEGETDRFKQIICTLKELSDQTHALEVWAQRNGLLELPNS